MATDPRGLRGIMSRGRNVYRGGSSAAHMGGGPQFGRPPTSVPIPLLRQLMLQRITGGAAGAQQPMSPNLDPGASPIAQMQAAAARRMEQAPPPPSTLPPRQSGPEMTGELWDPSFPQNRPHGNGPRALPPGHGGLVPPGHALKRIEFHPPTEMAQAKQIQQQQAQQQQPPPPWFDNAGGKFQMMKNEIPAQAQARAQKMKMNAMPVPGMMQRMAQRRVLGE